MSGVTTISFQRWWPRPAHRWWLRPWNPNPLMRGSERVEGAILIFAALAVLLSVPIAAAVGTAVYAAEIPAIRAERASRTTVDAVIADEPTGATSEGRTARVLWREHDRMRDAVVPVDRTAAKDDHLTVWIGPDGMPTNQPRSTDAAAIAGIAVGVIVVASTFLGGVLTVECVRRGLWRRNARRWDGEWRRFDGTARS